MFGVCPSCRTEIPHDATHQIPALFKTYRCQACCLNLQFSRTLGKMTLASFQPDNRASGRNETHLNPVPPVVWLNGTK